MVFAFDLVSEGKHFTVETCLSSFLRIKTLSMLSKCKFGISLISPVSLS